MSGLSYIFYSIYPFIGLVLLGLQVYLMYMFAKFLMNQSKRNDKNQNRYEIIRFIRRLVFKKQKQKRQ